MNIYPVLTGSRSIEFAGGGEVQQAVLAQALHEDGFRVSVLTADYGQPELVEHRGVRIRKVPSPGKRGIKGLRLIHPHMTDVVAGLQCIDPDIVYFRVAGFRAVAAAWYAYSRGKQFVYACASDLELLGDLPSGFRDAFLFRVALRSADHVLTQNMRQQELLRQKFGKEGVLIPNCYAEPEVGLASPGGPVLWVGTVKPAKRPEVFVELARRHPAKEFIMVGGADVPNGGERYYRDVRDAAAAVPNLKLTGHVPFPEVGRYFDGASLLVNSSPTEGFPNTFLQAWVRGVPTLSFVHPEVVPGETGTIACRDLGDLSARLGRLTTHHESWQMASHACKAYFTETHSVDSVLHRYRDLFEHMSQGIPAGGRPGADVGRYPLFRR